VVFDKTACAYLFEKYIYILALEMASPIVSAHCPSLYVIQEADYWPNQRRISEQLRALGENWNQTLADLNGSRLIDADQHCHSTPMNFKVAAKSRPRARFTEYLTTTSRFGNGLSTGLYIMAATEVLEIRITKKGQKSQNYLNHDCCRQNENDIPITDHRLCAI